MWKKCSRSMNFQWQKHRKYTARENLQKKQEKSASTNIIQVIVLYCFTQFHYGLLRIFPEFQQKFFFQVVAIGKCSIFKQNNINRVLLSPLISRNAERGKFNFLATQISRWSSCMLPLWRQVLDSSERALEKFEKVHKLFNAFMENYWKYLTFFTFPFLMRSSIMLFFKYLIIILKIGDDQWKLHENI